MNEPTSTLDQARRPAAGSRRAAPPRPSLKGPAVLFALVVLATIALLLLVRELPFGFPKRPGPSPVNSALVARVAGLTGYVLVTATLALGLTMGGLLDRRLRIRRIDTVAVHDFSALLTLVFIGVHVVATAMNPFKPWSVAQVLVPGQAPFQPVWIAVGTVTLYLAVATWLTGRLRGRLSRRTWKVLHATAVLVWVGATLHGVKVGADRESTLAQALFVVSTVLLLCLFVVRLLARRPSGPRP